MFDFKTNQPNPRKIQSKCESTTLNIESVINTPSRLRLISLKNKGIFTSKSKDNILKKIPLNIQKIVNIQFDKENFKNANIVNNRTFGTLSNIQWNDKEYHLNFPLFIEGIFINEFWELKNKFIDIICIAPTWEECIEEFMEEFDFLVEQYVNAQDNELSRDAIKLKNKLMNLITS